MKNKCKNQHQKLLTLDCVARRGIQWNLQIKDKLVNGPLSTIRRLCPLSEVPPYRIGTGQQSYASYISSISVLGVLVAEDCQS